MFDFIFHVLITCFNNYSSFVSQIAGKRDVDEERQAQHWIETITGEPFPANLCYEDALRNGVILCKLMSQLSPGSINKINTSGGDYKFMDNLNQ